MKQNTLRILIVAFGLCCAVVGLVRPWAPPPARAGEVAASFDSGTFTPTIVGISSAGTASYTVQVGRYTRQGNRVALNATLTFTGGNGTGQPAVAGLPLALRNVANDDTPCAVLTSSFTFGTGQLTAAIASNESQVRLWLVATGATLAVASYDAAATVYVQCNYEVTP